MQMRRRIAIYRARGVVLKRGGDPLAGVLRGRVPAQPGLYVFLGFIERGANRRSVRLAHAFILADQSRQAHGLRCIEGQIPTGTMPEFFARLRLDRVAMLE